jgi:hypothetical protein
MTDEEELAAAASLARRVGSICSVNLERRNLTKGARHPPGPDQTRGGKGPPKRKCKNY